MARATRWPATGQPLGTLLLALAALLPGCSVQPIPVHDPGLRAAPVRYLRHALRGSQEGYSIRSYRSAYLGDPVLFRPGSRVEITLYSQERIEFRLEGNDVWLLCRSRPFPTDPQGVKATLEEHFAVTREELNLDAIPAEIRRQIDEGAVAIGMTRDQVFLALGYPSHIGDTPAEGLDPERIFESGIWLYRHGELPVRGIYATYWTYRFDGAGKLVAVER